MLLTTSAPWYACDSAKPLVCRLQVNHIEAKVLKNFAFSCSIGQSIGAHDVARVVFSEKEGLMLPSRVFWVPVLGACSGAHLRGGQ